MTTAAPVAADIQPSNTTKNWYLNQAFFFLFFFAPIHFHRDTTITLKWIGNSSMAETCFVFLNRALLFSIASVKDTRRETCLGQRPILDVSFNGEQLIRGNKSCYHGHSLWIHQPQLAAHVSVHILCCDGLNVPDSSRSKHVDYVLFWMSLVYLFPIVSDRLYKRRLEVF